MNNISDDAAPPTSADFVDRAEHLPDDFMPDAKGAIIVSDAVTRLAGYRTASIRPPGWTFRRTGFSRSLGDHILWVKKCEGGLWTLERQHLLNHGEEALCHFLGGLPVLADNYAAGMRVVEFCYPKAPETLGWLHWMRCT
jgi:hypothetical protein